MPSGIVYTDMYGTDRVNHYALVSAYLKKYKTIQFHQLYFQYDDKTGKWEIVSTIVIKKQMATLLHSIRPNMWTNSLRDKVLELVEIETDIVEQMNTKRDYVCLDNCVVDVSTGKRYRFLPHYRFTSNLSYQYNRSAECRKFKKFLCEVARGDEKLILCLEEILGYCLTYDTKAQKCFYLYGNGANGKSVFLTILIYLAGKENIVPLNVNEFENPFRRAEVENKKVVIMNDLSKSDSYNFMTGEMKKVIAGELIGADRKYKTPFEFISQAKVVALSNFQFSFGNDKSDGALRRMLFLPFIATFSKKDRNVNLINELLEELPGIFLLASKGYQRLVANNYKFSYEEKSDLIANKLMMKSDPLYYFVQERIVAGDQFITYKNMSDEYRKWLSEKKLKDSNNNLSKRLSKEIGNQLPNAKCVKRNGIRGIKNITIK